MKSGSHQMQWHQTTTRWALNIKLRSSSTYEAIRQYGHMSLPSSSTLQDYAHFMENGTGFQADVTV